jgi:quercetin dioxygenase-like cupin family protein
MKTSRWCLLSLAAGVVAVIACAGESHDVSAHVKILQSVDVTTRVPEPMKSTTLIVNFAPGESHPPHRHPGPVFGYVLEGTLEFAINDEPVRTIKAGETFYEPTMVLHRVGKNPDQKNPTRVLVVMLHPKEASQLVIPEPHSLESRESESVPGR